MEDFKALKSRFESMRKRIDGIVSEMDKLETKLTGPQSGITRSIRSTGVSTSATSTAVDALLDGFKASLLVQQRELADLLGGVSALQTATTGTLSDR